MDQPVVPFDLARMFLGDQPPLFFAEIVFRTVLVYAYAFVLIRWVGGRTVAQLSIVEFILVIALGSAVGDPLFYPDVPILHAMAVITLVVLLNKGLDMAMLRSSRIQEAVDGVPRKVVADGRVLTENLDRRNVGLPQLLEMLRLKGISDLGEVSEAWLEGNGQLSVFKTGKPLPSCPILPEAKGTDEAQETVSTR